MIVYKLTSPSGKCYIGLSKGTLKARFKQHIQCRQRHKRNGKGYRGKGACPKLYYAFDKYAPETWAQEILFEDDNMDIIKQQEIAFIKQFDTITNGYNVLQGGQQGLAGHKLDDRHKNGIREAKLRYWQSEEGQKQREFQKEKYKGNLLSKGHTPRNKGIKNPFEITDDFRRKCSETNKGKILSMETRMKISTANKRKQRTPEQCAAQSARQKGRKQPESQKIKVAAALSKTYLITKPDGTTETITNLRQYCIVNGLHNGNMTSVAKGNLNHYKGYKCVQVLLPNGDA
jgi:hypothetical protein